MALRTRQEDKSVNSCVSNASPHKAARIDASPVAALHGSTNQDPNAVRRYDTSDDDDRFQEALLEVGRAREEHTKQPVKLDEAKLAMAKSSARARKSASGGQASRIARRTCSP